MRTSLSIAITVAAASLANASILEIPMDSLAPSGYFTAPPPMIVQVVTESARTFIQTSLLSESEDAANFRAPIVNFETYSGAPVNAAAGNTLEFDVRYFQDLGGENGEQPYDDRYTMFDVVLFTSSEQSWTWPDAFNNPTPHGAWHHLSLNLADTAGNPNFDLSQLRRMEIHGFNPRYSIPDHIALDNLVITPEPSSLLLLSLAALFVRRR